MESKFLSPAVLKQATLSICVSLSYFCIGLVRGFSSPAVPSINELNPGLFPDKNIESWASSIPPLGAFFGSLFSAPLMHLIGRKYTVMIASPIWMASWTIIALSTQWEMIMAGRMLSGVCAGITLPSAQIYVSECSDPSIRGIIGSFPSLAMSLGILLAYILGKFLPWTQLAWASNGIALLLLFSVMFLPESPVWLKTKGRIDDASKAAKWLHLSGFSLEDSRGIENKEDSVKKEKPFSRKILFSRPVLMPLGIGLTLLAFQQLSGIDAIIFFTVEIFKAAGSSLDEHLATIIVGLVQVLSNFLSLFIVDRSGRKPLLISSGIIMTISTASMGAAFYLNNIGNTFFGFLPVASLIIFMIGYSIGFGCIPFLLLGEIFPTAQRSLLSSLAGSFNLVVMFIVIKTYHPLETIITTAGTFWMYAVLCGFGVLFVIIFLPETKGRDLEIIAKLFEKNESVNINDDNKNKKTVKKNGIDNLGVQIDEETRM